MVVLLLPMELATIIVAMVVSVDAVMLSSKWATYKNAVLRCCEIRDHCHCLHT
jgi:hypothetical protein